MCREGSWELGVIGWNSLPSLGLCGQGGYRIRNPLPYLGLRTDPNHLYEFLDNQLPVAALLATWKRANHTAVPQKNGTLLSETTQTDTSVIPEIMQTIMNF